MKNFEKDKIYCADSRNMKEIPDDTIQLIITSPPYNAEKDYDYYKDNKPLEEYLGLLYDVWKECSRVLCTGGRICINVANIGRKPYLALSDYISKQLIDLGFLMRGELIWNKEASVGTSTAWGSWKSPSNPTLRDLHEYILIFSKEEFKLENHRNDKSDLTSEEFLEYTKSVWNFPTESAKKVGHPTPFPEELPKRLIKLYSYPKDVVLDPFAGSGTTLLVAKKLGRHYAGYEISKKYCELAKKRIIEAFAQKTLKQTTA